MVSIRGRIFRSALRRKFSLNPKVTPDPVTKMRKACENIVDDKVPEGFYLVKERTENGTKFDRVLKDTDERKDRVIFYLHGGAYVIGLLNVYRDFAADYYKATGGCELILLDYDLAPENVYPTQLNQAYDLWNELINNRGYSPSDIVVIGDSAGANLAVSLMLKIRDNGFEMPRAGVCISLWGDMTCSGESYVKNYSRDAMFGQRGSLSGEEFIVERNRLINSRLFDWCLGADRSDPYVSPTLGDFSGFPQMFFTVGSHEILYSDTFTVVKKLSELGISAQVEIGEGMFHTYPLFRALVPEGKTSFDKILEFIESVYKEN